MKSAQEFIIDRVKEILDKKGFTVVQKTSAANVGVLYVYDAKMPHAIGAIHYDFQTDAFTMKIDGVMRWFLPKRDGITTMTSSRDTPIRLGFGMC